MIHLIRVGDKHTIDHLKGISTSVFDFTGTDGVLLIQNCPRGFVGMFFWSIYNLYQETDQTLNLAFFQQADLEDFVPFMNMNILLCYQQTQGSPQLWFKYTVRHNVVKKANLDQFEEF